MQKTGVVSSGGPRRALGPRDPSRFQIGAQVSLRLSMHFPIIIALLQESETDETSSRRAFEPFPPSPTAFLIVPRPAAEGCLATSPFAVRRAPV